MTFSDTAQLFSTIQEQYTKFIQDLWEDPSVMTSTFQQKIDTQSFQVPKPQIQPHYLHKSADDQAYHATS